MEKKAKYSNDDMVEELIKGSTTMFRCVYDTYYTQLNRFAFHIIMCPESHDIVHDVLAKVWEIHESLPSDLNLKSYLFTAVKNSCLNYIKRMEILDENRDRIVEAMVYIENDDNDDDEYKTKMIKVSEYLDKLPSQQKNIVKMKIEGKSYKEIADLLNISVKTVNNHIVKAYQFIRDNVLFISVLICVVGALTKLK